MGVFKNEIGRPSNKVLKTRKVLIGSSIFAFAIVFTILANVMIPNNSKKLSGALAQYNVKSKECIFHILNIKSKSAEAYWNCPYHQINSFTVYESDSTGKEGKKVFGTIYPKTYKQASMWAINSGLKPETSYVIKYKQTNLQTYSIKFKTPKSGVINPVKVNHRLVSVSNITDTSARVTYTGISLNGTKVTIYESNSSGSIGKKFKSYSVSKQHGEVSFLGLGSNRYYVAVVKFSDGKTGQKLFKTSKTNSKYIIKGSTCVFQMINIKTNKAQAYWQCDTGGVSSFTVYDSNANGSIGKKLYGPKVPSYKKNAIMDVNSNLLSGHWYVISFKTKDKKVYNLNFQTPTKGTSNPLEVNRTNMNVKNITSSSAVVEYKGISTKATEVILYTVHNGQNVKYKSYKVNAQDGTQYMSGMNKNTKYYAAVMFDNKVFVGTYFTTKK